MSTEPTIEAPPDVRVTFTDGVSQDFQVDLPRQGHTDHEVVAVAYKMACGKIYVGEWYPQRELRFVSIRRLG